MCFIRVYSFKFRMPGSMLDNLLDIIQTLIMSYIQVQVVEAGLF